MGVLAQVVGPDPTNGAPPIPSSQLALLTDPTTNLSFTLQPSSINVFEGGSPVFKGSAKSDSEFPLAYQWLRDGTNIPGATGSSYSFTTVVADNGAKFSLVVTTAVGGLVITSTNAALTVQQAVFEKGLALMRYWANKTPADFATGESGGFGDPDFQMAVTSFEAGVNNENGHSYVSAISGFFVPATSGRYDFIISGDDHCDLFLSTDSSPNNKRLVCQQVGWCNALVWGPESGVGGGGTDDVQKNSATWTNATGTAVNNGGIQLTAGTKYTWKRGTMKTAVAIMSP